MARSTEAEDTEDDFKPLSAQEAQALRDRHPPVSPWRVVIAQVIAGAVMCALTWIITRRGEATLSALFGAAIVVLPQVVLVRGMTRWSGSKPAAKAAGFLIWEGVKILMAVVMLATASRVVPGLSWPALLVTMVVCMKFNWLALLWRGQNSNHI